MPKSSPKRTRKPDTPDIILNKHHESFDMKRDQITNQVLIAAFQSNRLKKSPPKVALSSQEKKRLASVKPRITLRSILEFTPTKLSEMTGIGEARCEHILALTQFQLLGSVSQAAAKDLWTLGFARLEQLEDADPLKMYDDFSKVTGAKSGSLC